MLNLFFFFFNSIILLKRYNRLLIFPSFLFSRIWWLINIITLKILFLVGNMKPPTEPVHSISTHIIDFSCFNMIIKIKCLFVRPILDIHFISSENLSSSILTCNTMEKDYFRLSQYVFEILMHCCREYFKLIPTPVHVISSNF